MTQIKENLIHFKERLVYEIATSLNLDTENLDTAQIPEHEDPVYNVHLVLKRNLDILKKMKEV
jgi:hypothetical protein